MLIGCQKYVTIMIGDDDAADDPELIALLKKNLSRSEVVRFDDNTTYYVPCIIFNNIAKELDWRDEDGNVYHYD